MFPAWGFVDTLAEYSGVNHASALIALTANPYAAMPSLHSMDAFIVGVVMFGVCRSLWARDDLAALAGLGLVLGHRDRQPLLARRRRRRRDRDRHRRRALPPAACSGAGAQPLAT